MVYRGCTSEYSDKWANFSHIMTAGENSSLSQITELRANKVRPKAAKAGILLQGVLTRKEVLSYLQSKDSSPARLPSDRKPARRMSDLDPTNDRRVFQLNEDELVNVLDKKANAHKFKHVSLKSAAAAQSLRLQRA